jgi:hypothetical protein
VVLLLTLPGRPSLLGVIAIRMSCRTPSIASYLRKRRTSSRHLEMVHNQDMTMELSNRLLAAQ